MLIQDSGWTGEFYPVSAETASFQRSPEHREAGILDQRRNLRVLEGKAGGLQKKPYLEFPLAGKGCTL